MKPAIVAALRAVHAAAQALRLEFFVAGALARDIWLDYIYRVPVARLTGISTSALKSPVPEKYSWPSLIKKDGDELFDHYRHTLEALGLLARRQATRRACSG